MSAKRNLLHAPRIARRKRSGGVRLVRMALRSRLSGAVSRTPEGRATNNLHLTVLPHHLEDAK